MTKIIIASIVGALCVGTVCIVTFLMNFMIYKQASTRFEKYKQNFEND